jgi:hypothetical protein
LDVAVAALRALGARLGDFGKEEEKLDVVGAGLVAGTLLTTVLFHTLHRSKRDVATEQRQMPVSCFKGRKSILNLKFVEV